MSFRFQPSSFVAVTLPDLQERSKVKYFGCLFGVVLMRAEILHQLIGSLSHSHYFRGFIHFRWCRISSTNSSYIHPQCEDFVVAPKNGCNLPVLIAGNHDCSCK